MPLLYYNNEEASYTFLEKVFNRFGALVEVFTNQGIEFWKEFQKLCEKTLIHHCTTSQDHHEVDELIEQMVQTMKKGL